MQYRNIVASGTMQYMNIQYILYIQHIYILENTI